MNELPRQKLREIVARHGQAVALDERRCEGLLRDYCGEYRREVSVLVMALEERVPSDLLAAPANTPREVLLTRLARRLCDNLALSEEAAVWAVGSWASALELISDDELKSIEERRRPAPVTTDAPRPAPVATGATHFAPTSAAATTAAATAVVSADGHADYTTVSAALQHAAPGSRILVRPGVYDESITLDKQVQIVGDGPREKIIWRGVDSSCVRMLAERAWVAGITLRGAARGGAGFFAVDIPQGALMLEDCDVSSTTLSCVGVHGASAAPLIIRCLIHDGADSGLYFFDGAVGSVQDCVIYRNANVGVAITGRAKPAVRNSKIFGGANAGVVIWEDGEGVVEECEIYDNAKAGLGASEGGRATLRSCSIHDGDNSGVFVHEGGEVTLENCELYGHREAQAAVTTRGHLTMRGCRVHHGRDFGVFVRDEGRAVLQECTVTGNAYTGVIVSTGSTAALLACQINDNGGYAVKISGDCAARIEDSDLTGNHLGPWDVEYGAAVEAERNREDQ